MVIGRQDSVLAADFSRIQFTLDLAHAEGIGADQTIDKIVEKVAVA